MCEDENTALPFEGVDYMFQKQIQNSSVQCSYVFHAALGPRLTHLYNYFIFNFDKGIKKGNYKYFLLLHQNRE